MKLKTVWLWPVIWRYVLCLVAVTALVVAVALTVGATSQWSFVMGMAGGVASFHVSRVLFGDPFDFKWK